MGTTPKTQATPASVSDFIATIATEERRQDCKALLALMETATGARATMWGTAIVGFGTYRYKYASGQEGEWPVVGFSPRKTNLTLYIMPGFEHYDNLLKSLGKFKIGKSCLYVKSLSDVDLVSLRKLIDASVNYMREKYG